MRPVDRRTFLSLTALLAAGCTAAPAADRFTVAGGERGGLYFAFAELLARQLGVSNPGLQPTAISTEGSVDNLARLRAGTVDMGLALADVAERDRAAGPADTGPVAVARVYENYLQVVVREASPVDSLKGLTGKSISIGPPGSGAAAISEVLFEAAGLGGQVEMRRLRLRDGLNALVAGTVEALVWSGGVPTPAISDVDHQVSLRMLDIGGWAARMEKLSGYPYLMRTVPSGAYAPPGLNTIGVPNLLLCPPGLPAPLVEAVVHVLAADAPRLVPPGVRGLQYLDPPSMIQTGAIPLHPAAAATFRELHS
jgi:TRAP transporter TAXI family solute receptor